MELSDIIKQQAALCGDVSIDVDESFQTVAIGENIFMQGDEAQSFIDEAEKLYNEAQDVTMDECYACVAHPYIECLE